MSKVNIGYKDGMKVMIESEIAVNPHVALIGASGSGKTVEAQRIISGLVEQGETVLVISIHNSFIDNQILPYYKEVINKHRCDVYAHRDGIPCRLFEPLIYEDKTKEDVEDVAGAVTDIIERTLSMGRRQKGILRTVIEEVIDAGEYHEKGFIAIGDMLKSLEDKRCDDLYEKYSYVFRKNLFYDGDLLKEGKVNIIHLDHFDLELQDTVAELLLSYLWRVANAGIFQKNKVFLFVDECQNMISSAKGALAHLISEGRKLGINLILATQMILNGSSNAVQQRISQCGTILYFKPASNRIKQTAKLISPGTDIKWGLRLKRLKVGEFVATGDFMVGEETINYPLVVDANIERIRGYDEVSNLFTKLTTTYIKSNSLNEKNM